MSSQVTRQWVRQVRSRVGRSCVVVAAVGLLSGCDHGTPGAAVDDADGPATIWFNDVAPQVEVRFEHVSGQRGDDLYLPEIVAGGAAMLDMNGNGWMDIYFVQSGFVSGPIEKNPQNQLFRNDGHGSFTDITAPSRAGDRGYGMGVAVGDYNNNGFPDLYVTNLGPNVLLRNNGDETFTDVSREAGVDHPAWGTSAAFLDYNLNGHLDLFVTNYIHWSIKSERTCYRHTGERDYCAPSNYNAPTADVLFRNEGNGRFADVSREAGIDAALGNGLGVVCADFNDSGWVDIFVANDATPNHLWINQGDGTFREQAFLSGCAIDQDGKAKAGMGVAVTDLDRDGRTDLLVVNLVNETDSFYRNMGTYFIDDTARVGLRGTTRRYTRFGVGFVDFANRGVVDIFQANGRVAVQSPQYSNDPYAEPNMLVLGTESGRFIPAEPQDSVRQQAIFTSRAAVFGDVDNDGGIDILLVNRDAPAQLFKNVVPDRGHWIMFRVLNEHGSDAYHARVTVELGDVQWQAEVRSAFSYLAANDPRLHLGLGDRTTVPGVSVRWTDGTIEHFGSFEADQIVELRRGDGQIRRP